MEDYISNQMKCVYCGNIMSTNDDICSACGRSPRLRVSSINLYTKTVNANELLNRGEFSDARDSLLRIVKEFANEDLADVYFSLYLCEEEVLLEYDYDKDKDGTLTVFPSFLYVHESEQTEKYYKKAIECAKCSRNNKKDIFEKLHKRIEVLRNEYKQIEKRSQPFKIFISYKKSLPADSTKETGGADLARHIFRELSPYYKVFLGEQTLKGISTMSYEANIFYAINTANILILICEQKDYLTATWVKNEWSRYLALSGNSSGEKIIIPIFMKGFNESLLPSEIRKLRPQAIFDGWNLAKDLQTRIDKIFEEPVKTETDKLVLNQKLDAIYREIESEVYRWFPRRKKLKELHKKYNQINDQLKRVLEQEQELED